ncbi:hypothetical protein SASPL_157198 [Salvia splendens]|uniref:Uncharacterized protein n=1 Tax=Salvia splendens TaxID=180675 RepID=A0A8X8VVC7_SALSN|nr:hypothetical protein SASPL_157198 [Salvia splendens]
MKPSLSASQQIRPSLHIPSTSSQLLRHGQPKEKVVVVLGVTGAGKPRLSIDLATRFSAEIINSDKMQVYQGLKIATHKITDEERRGVPHHLLGVADPESDFSTAEFRAMASHSLRSILSRRNLPIIVGGSNSFVEALIDVTFQSRYDCCFLWVDVAMPMLASMVERGMIEEETRARALAEATDAIKVNTSRLACRQLEKIHRLRNIRDWRMHRLDATEVFRKRGGEAEAVWNSVVAGTAEAVVSRFLYDSEPVVYGGAMSMRSGAQPLLAATAS